ncbi:DNA double-strand break repair nuclease NurA [Campylobacter sp. MIT 19-121]|uniref:DNA double-strand break repair nuclease NurA n=1 Tax=Campylobacter sp. MIT 19-121 TaxID=2703906 RepID=UPI00138A394D|nr:DNA double-strand break repair nuclease NurA [Campylobacter sp. MIT 19-121]NDJ27821.1 DNA double-strand break repair nuclease NurA [Campylobacter sp. MIT 19-121]
MGYFKEKASKANHQYIINSELVQEYLKKCIKASDTIPQAKDYERISRKISCIENKIETTIKQVAIVDGGYTEVLHKEGEISYKLCYCIIGVLVLNIQNISKNRKTVNPNELDSLQNLDRFACVLPLQNIKLKDMDFKQSIRKTIFDIFMENKLAFENKHNSYPLIHTLKWLLFKEYSDKPDDFITLICPTCERQNKINNLNERIKCFHCKKFLYITDCFKLHELINENENTSAICSYFINTLESMVIISMFYILLQERDKNKLSEWLFIKDGSLALFNAVKSFSYNTIRPFLQYWYEESIKDNISYFNFIGLEKNGTFTWHLRNVINIIPAQTIVLPNQDYIKHFIADNTNIYGKDTYFGIKMFVKKDKNTSFVLDVALPFGIRVKYEDYIKNPSFDDFLCLKEILEVLFQLECNLYKNSFIPTTMINRFVSLSNIPGKKILTMFSKALMNHV